MSCSIALSRHSITVPAIISITSSFRRINNGATCYHGELFPHSTADPTTPQQGHPKNLQSSHQQLPKPWTSTAVVPVSDTWQNKPSCCGGKHVENGGCNAEASSGHCQVHFAKAVKTKHQDLVFTISSGLGSFRGTAKIHNGIGRGHNLAHPFDDQLLAY